MFAETFDWHQGLNEKYSGARPFYLVVCGSIAAGIAFTFFGINPVKALYWTAIINGVLSPFFLVGLLLVACDRKLMSEQPSSRLGIAMVGVTALVMTAAALAMLVL